ncbi:MAG TPA: ATP phosphoribosyltransferase regulatory subunit, partial [Thermoclostridium sp.]|nr:ATP phosphoribosyltransferase regulatory subunit [Thermoclostridium sp.]
MALELRNLKGTSDFLPEEQKIRQEMIRTLQDVFERYGYQPIETPTICYFDVLASKYSGGAEILKEVYKLNDQGKRELGLRYDLTIPFARLIGMNPNITMPFKRYEIGKVYRDGPVKTGRNREFIQCDVDMVGVKSIMAEAEFMMMTVEIYKKLGLDVYISY